MSTHVPVLLKEVLSAFAPQQGDTLLDATLGLGGHAKAYLDAAPDTCVIGFDADSSALDEARLRLAAYGERARYVHANFASLAQALVEHASDWSVRHILFDLGIGSHQIADDERGFSFTSSAPLHMKYGEITQLPPAQVEALNHLERRLAAYPDAVEIIRLLSGDELAEVIRKYGEERYARRIANAIASADPKPTTAKELAEAIVQAVPSNYGYGPRKAARPLRGKRIHPATRTFQALRLAVNRELEVLESALPQAEEIVAPGGKIAVISFHSLEDRIVKHFFRKAARDCICPPEQPQCTCSKRASLAVVTRRPITPSDEELAANPRARSAKLRVASKPPD